MRQENFNYPGEDIGGPTTQGSPQACAEKSVSAGGLFWTYSYGNKKCWVKSSDSGKKSEEGKVSGSRACAFPKLTSLGVFTSQSTVDNPPQLCSVSNPFTFCVVDKAPFPWMALVLASKAKVDRVEIKFRDNCCGEMLRNIEVRVTDTLPTTGFHPPSYCIYIPNILLRRKDV